MVNIGAIWDGLMTCRAVVSWRTVGIYAKRLCHVPNLKEVGACLSRNLLWKSKSTHSLCFLLVVVYHQIPTPSSPPTQNKTSSVKMWQIYDYWNHGREKGLGKSVLDKVASKMVINLLCVANPNSTSFSLNCKWWASFGFVHVLFICCSCWLFFWRQCKSMWRQAQRNRNWSNDHFISFS